MSMDREYLRKLLQDRERQQQQEQQLEQLGQQTQRSFQHVLLRSLDAAFTLAYHLLQEDESRALALVRRVFADAYRLHSSIHSETALQHWVFRTIQRRAAQQPWPARIASGLKHLFSFDLLARKKPLIIEEERHQRFRDAIQGALDGELSPAEHTELERHLRQCPACQQEYAQSQAGILRLRTLLRPVPAPEQLWTTIRRDIARLETAPRMASRGLMHAAAVAASLIFLVLAGLSYYHTRQHLELLENQVRAATLKEQIQDAQLYGPRSLPLESILFDGQDIVILTGALASDGFSFPSVYSVLHDVINDPRQTHFLRVSGDISSLTAALRAKIEAQQGKIIAISAPRSLADGFELVTINAAAAQPSDTTPLSSVRIILLTR